jgi:molybdopterin adenylyltransferase
VVELLRAQWTAAEIWTGLLADDEDAIAAMLEQLSRDGAALVLTVGGTGFGPRDRTPEATRRVFDREAPGLAEAMRFHGAGSNPFAWLSRGVAGMKGSTLIVNLPGSRRGAEESLASIMALLEHGLEIAAGGQDHPQTGVNLLLDRS